MLQHCAGLPRCCGADNTHSACWPMNSQTTKDQQKNVNSTCSLLVGKHLGGDTCLLMGPYGAMHGTAQKPLIPSWDHESRHTPHLCEPCRTTATTRAKTAGPFEPVMYVLTWCGPCNLAWTRGHLPHLVPKCKDMVENMGVGDSNTSSDRTQSSAVDVIKDLDIDVVIESATRNSKCKRVACKRDC